jgi:hypothetical protein
MQDVTRGLRKSEANARGASEGDAVAEDARFGSVKDEQFGTRADGERRRATIALAELWRKVDIEFRRAVRADDVQHQAIRVHHEDGVAPDGETAVGIPFRAARSNQFGDQVTVAGEFHNSARRGAKVEQIVGSVHEGTKTTLARNRFARLPGLHQALTNGVGENFSGHWIEDVNEAIIADGYAQGVLDVRARAEMKLAKAVTVGKKNEDTVAEWISHVNGARAIQGDRLRMIHSVFLERKQWLAFESEFGDEGAAGISEENVSEGIRGDSRRLAELPGITSLRAPLADVGE